MSWQSEKKKARTLAWDDKTGDIYCQAGIRYFGIKLRLWGARVIENQLSKFGSKQSMLSRTNMRKD